MKHVCKVCGDQLTSQEFDKLSDEFKHYPAHVECFDSFESVDEFIMMVLKENEAMKPTKHTPGPWMRSGSGIKSKSRMIAIQAVKDAECGANAALIAAAPEMLDVLCRLVSMPKYELDNVIALAQDVIAKALGRGE